MITQIEQTLKLLRANKPLVLNLTNYVTMDFVSNCLLALGAAPIMSRSKSEMEELVGLCAAIYINIGTLDDAFIERVDSVVAFAQKHHKPIVLDPVGAGATKIRTDISKRLLPYVDIIRGNASEVIALGSTFAKTKGVESVNSTDEAKTYALHLACQHTCSVTVSGMVDFITDGIRQSEVPYGASLMPFVTGMGCALTAVIAAFSAVVPDSFEASRLATHYFGLCGTLAAKNANHPGRFRTDFIDQLHAANYDHMRTIYDQ